jgi:hypothetical protein
VTEHVCQLLAAGVLGVRIATVAGVSLSQVFALAAGARRFVQRSVADAVLAVPLRAALGGDLTEAVRRHLRGLLAQRLTLAGIARAAGVHPQTVRDAAAGRRRVEPHTAAALLGCRSAPWPPSTRTGRLVPAVGARRRVEALQAMGWRRTDIVQATGLPETVLPLRGQHQVQFRTSLAIRDTYERLCMRAGPSAATAARARSLGYASPLAWDGDASDDPAAQPEGLAAVGRMLRRRCDVSPRTPASSQPPGRSWRRPPPGGDAPRTLGALCQVGRSDLVSALKRGSRRMAPSVSLAQPDAPQCHRRPGPIWGASLNDPGCVRRRARTAAVAGTCCGVAPPGGCAIAEALVSSGLSPVTTCVGGPSGGTARSRLTGGRRR